MAFNLLGILSFLTDLLPFAMLLYWRNLLKKKLLLVVFTWTIFSLGADFLIAFNDDQYKELLVFLVILTEVMFVCTFYYVMANRRSTKIISAVCGAAFALVALYVMFTQQLDSFKYWMAASAALLTMLLSVVIFIDFFNTYQNSFLLDAYQIWIPLAYMIYAAGNLFLFATTEHFPDIFSNPGMWSIFLVANIIKNAFFVKSILIARKPLQSGLRERNLSYGGDNGLGHFKGVHNYY
jgi:hypothetical protein